MKLLVIALGGNALLQRGEVLSAENQYKSIDTVTKLIAKLTGEYRIAIVHGNGPQVGLLALQNINYPEVPAYPLDILVAETQGMIGYMIAERLQQQHQTIQVATLLTRVEVDENDPSFKNPTKFIGPVYSPDEKERLEKQYGWQFKVDGKYIRRVVPSPRPQKIIDINAIKLLLEQNFTVISNGGGGIPMVNGPQGFAGVEAVVDKDLAAAQLAIQLKADHLLILTDADAVYQDWGKPTQRALHHLTPATLSPFSGDDGAMGPKAGGVIEFVEKTGNTAFIGALKDAPEILKGLKGTKVTPN